MPNSTKVEFARQQRCQSPACTLDHWLPEPSYAFNPYEGVPAQAAVWAHALTRGSKLIVPWHADLELVVVSLDGSLQAVDSYAATRTAPTVRVPAWHALRASGAGVELQCTSDGCQTALALIAPGSTLSAALQNRGATQTVKGPRTRPLETRAFTDAKQYSWNGGASHARILFGGDEAIETAPDNAGRPPLPLPFSLSLLEADPEVSIVEHIHEQSWEHLLVLQGSGELLMRGRPYPIAGGEVIHIDRSIRHGFAAMGETPLVALQLYTPAGPEQRFIRAAEPSKPDSGPKPAVSAKVPR